MQAARSQFSSRVGFLMAATGSAVGLGNIWGFPTQAASNGGAAFVLVYLVLAFCLAYPALMAELLIGRYANANSVNAFKKIAIGPKSRRLGAGIGFFGIIVGSLILSFYAIVAGWMIAYTLEAVAQISKQYDIAAWLIEFSTSRNIIFCFLFLLLTALIISDGVQSGIEKWSSRLMPMLVIIMLILIAYVLTQEGAIEGFKVYLLPDFSHLNNPKLLINALGQAFFSLSLGVGTMLIYGSYISKNENLPVLGVIVTLVDIGVAVIAGLLIIPAMYVALHNGVEIFSASGKLLSEDTLIFTVLPAFFKTLGIPGLFFGFAFFCLMTIAALTSSISMLEIAVAYAIENHGIKRKRAALLTGGIIFLISLIIILNFQPLFSFVITLTTRYSQPLLGLAMCIFAGWIWQRNSMLEEIKQGTGTRSKWFWKIWPTYVRYICPAFILAMLIHSFIG